MERLFDGHENGLWAAWELGDPNRRSAARRSMMQIAEELRQPAQRWSSVSSEAVLALAEGRFAAAGGLIEQAASVGERARSSPGAGGRAGRRAVWSTRRMNA